MNFDADFSMTIDGEPITSTARLDVHNPATGCVFATAPIADAAILDLAVSSAQSAC